MRKEFISFEIFLFIRFYDLRKFIYRFFYKIITNIYFAQLFFNFF